MNPFQTSDQPLAAYLVSQGLDLLGAIPTADPKRLNFVLLDRDDRTQLEEDFYSDQAQVSPREYAKFIKQVNRALKTPYNPEAADESTT